MREALADRMMIKVISSLPPCREVPCGLEAKVECSQLLPMIKTKGIGDDRALVKLGGVGDDDRTDQDDVGYEQVPIASSYLFPYEVVPHFNHHSFSTAFHLTENQRLLLL